MNPVSLSLRSDVIAAPSMQRPTPKPVRVSFTEVLATGARGVIAGAEAAVSALPGGAFVAVALRGASHGAVAMNTPMMAGSSGASSGVSVAPEGPGVSGAAAGGEGGIASSLEQSQQMNLYYLQIQEQVNAQNRSFSTLSNVLKAEHDTVKTAIGNIR